jgi:hypothetical protein
MTDKIKTELKRELSYAPIIETILADHAGLIHRRGFKVFDLKKATAEEDSFGGFDFVFEMGSFTVPVRIRRPDCKFRDFTIRSRSRGGGKTELQKIREGAGDVYFYAWTEDFLGVEMLSEFMLVDLDAIRKAGLLASQSIATRREISNGDGTKFISISIIEINAASALIIRKKP